MIGHLLKMQSHIFTCSGISYILVNGILYQIDMQQQQQQQLQMQQQQQQLLQMQQQQQLLQMQQQQGWTPARLNRDVPSIYTDAGSLIPVNWLSGTPVEYAPRPGGGCYIRCGLTKGWVTQNPSFGM
jgi:type II secretory pathway pseudopilin PulG